MIPIVIPRIVGLLWPLFYEDDFHAQPSGGGGGLGAPIRMESGASYYIVCLIPEGVCHQILQLSRFVAAEGESRQVIPFDEDSRPVEDSRQVW